MTERSRLPWTPGSFTKNFGWGDATRGLSELHSIIRIGFDGKVEDTPRRIFRDRVKSAGKIDYIPVNFFLLNRVLAGVDILVADELVFNAINFRHSRRFDKLAMFAFNLSMVGVWKGASEAQSRPALWAHYYVRDRIAKDFGWDTRKISADDIESFVKNDRRYTGQTARKLATNLAYLFRIGRIAEYKIEKIDRWWVDCIFLALDREISDRSANSLEVREADYATYLRDADFDDLSGPRSAEKAIAIRHMLALYIACGGIERFSAEAMRQRTAIKLPDLQPYASNDPSPSAAFHLTNPSLVKAIPRACAMLARYLANFEVIDWSDLDDFDVLEFVRRNLKSALDEIEVSVRRPNVSVEDYLKLMRDDD